jgi:hypothetical protein
VEGFVVGLDVGVVRVGNEDDFVVGLDVGVV